MPISKNILPYSIPRKEDCTSNVDQNRNSTGGNAEDESINLSPNKASDPRNGNTRKMSRHLFSPHPGFPCEITYADIDLLLVHLSMNSKITHPLCIVHTKASPSVCVCGHYGDREWRLHVQPIMGFGLCRKRQLLCLEAI
jgi:hypothetical protein